MSKVTEILEEVEREAVQSGEPHIWLIKQAEQAIMEWVIEVIGSDREIPDDCPDNCTIHTHYIIDAINEEKDEQRKRAGLK